MSDTLTTPTFERGTLTLVTVSEEYYGKEWDGPSSGMTDNPHDTTESRTYYATYSRDMGSEWFVVVVPTTDPRSLHMWSLSPDVYGLSSLVGDGKEYRGWNIERRYATAVESTDNNSARIETDKDARALLPIQEAYPVGSVWNHMSYGEEPIRVTGHRDDWNVEVAFRENNRDYWTRGALDSYGTFVGWHEEASEASPEASGGSETDATSEAGTFTREDLDAAVKEAVAREREALVQFKEYANGIAVQYAKDNELCHNFELCMQDIGLMGREEWDEAHRVPWTVTFEITVQANDDDDARERAAEEIAARYSYQLTDLITDVEED